MRLQDIEGVLAWVSEGGWVRFAGPVTRLTRLIPEEVLVGYHLCYGTFPEWPMYEARDYAVLVGMANFAVANSGRTVDWLHLAGPRYLRSEDRSFFRPLVEIEAGAGPRVPRDCASDRRRLGARARASDGLQIHQRLRGRHVLRLWPSARRRRDGDDARAPAGSAFD